MAIQKEYLEDIYTREFYEFYKRNRKKTSPKINQEMLFKKAIQGFIIEIKKCVEETEHGVHLRGLGVIHKKHLKEHTRKLSLFTFKKEEYANLTLHLEDEYLRSRYYVKHLKKYMYSGKYTPPKKFKPHKPEAILLHRKLIRKNGISNT